MSTDGILYPIKEEHVRRAYARTNGSNHIFPRLAHSKGRISSRCVMDVIFTLEAYCRDQPVPLATFAQWCRMTEKEVCRILRELYKRRIISSDRVAAVVIDVDYQLLDAIGAADQIARTEAVASNRRLRRSLPAADIPRGWQAYVWGHERPLNRPGVYVIYGDWLPIYIGSSSRVAARIAAHAISRSGCSISTPWGTFGVVVVKVRYSRRFADWLTREARLINRLQPPGNIAGTRRTANGCKAAKS